MQVKNTTIRKNSKKNSGPSGKRSKPGRPRLAPGKKLSKATWAIGQERLDAINAAAAAAGISAGEFVRRAIDAALADG